MPLFRLMNFRLKKKSFLAFIHCIFYSHRSMEGKNSFFELLRTGYHIAQIFLLTNNIIWFVIKRKNKILRDRTKSKWPYVFNAPNFFSIYIKKWFPIPQCEHIWCAYYSNVNIDCPQKIIGKPDRNWRAPLKWPVTSDNKK